MATRRSRSPSNEQSESLTPAKSTFFPLLSESSPCTRPTISKTNFLLAWWLKVAFSCQSTVSSHPIEMTSLYSPAQITKPSGSNLALIAHSPSKSMSVVSMPSQDNRRRSQKPQRIIDETSAPLERTFKTMSFNPGNNGSMALSTPMAPSDSLWPNQWVRATQLRGS